MTIVRRRRRALVDSLTNIDCTVVPGAVLDLRAHLAALGAGPGTNDPAIATWADVSGNANHGTLNNFDFAPVTQRTNLATDPGCEGTFDAQGFPAYWHGFHDADVTGVTIARSKVAALPSSQGQSAWRNLFTGGAGASNGSVQTYRSTAMTGMAGKSWTWTFDYLYAKTGAVTVSVIVTDNGWAHTMLTDLVPCTSPTHLALTLAMPADHDTGQFYIIASGIDNGDIVDFTIDDILVEQATTDLGYFDGHRPNCVWSGAVNASTSLYQFTDGWAGTGTLADPHRLVFDGVSDYVTIGAGAAPGLADFTLEAWVWIPSGVTNNYGVVVGHGYPNDASHYSIFTTDTNRLAVGLSGGVGGWSDYILVELGLPVYDQWRHIVGAFDRDGNLTAYVDGAAYGSPVSIAARSAVNYSTAPNMGYHSGPWYSTEDIALTRIYPFALTAPQVAQNYAAGYLIT